jgi:hypothetical protein
MKKRVTGLGGVFFKSANPEALRQWYKEHLEIDSGEHGAMFNWRYHDDPAREGNTVWSVFPDDTGYFKPGTREFMFNYRVENLEELLRVLKMEGVEVVGDIEEYPYGNKIELWEPLNEKTL